MTDLVKQPPAIGLLLVRQIVKPRGWRRGKHHHTGAQITVMVMMSVAAMGRRVMIAVMMMVGIVIVMMLTCGMMIVIERKIGEEHVLMVGAGDGMLHAGDDAGRRRLDENQDQRRA